MKHGCSSKWYTKKEKKVAKLLLKLHYSEPSLLSWGCKRKRCAGRYYFSRDTRTVKNKLLLKTSSPDTPLCFHPNENLNFSRKEQSLKKLINGQKSESTLEFGGSMLQSVHVNSCGSKVQITNMKQPQNEKLPMKPFQNQICEAIQSERFIAFEHRTASLQVPSSSSNGLGHPDLNINPVEFTQINSSESQQLDEATANREFKRALATEARRRRILILKIKCSRKSRNDYR